MNINQQISYLSLDMINEYANHLDQLEFFVANVNLTQPKQDHLKQWTYQNCGQILLSSYEKYGIKVIKIWKSLIQRLNHALKGITSIHCDFLKVCIKVSMYKHALQIMQTPGLPFYINLQSYQKYLISCAFVYIEYRKIYESIKCLEVAKNIQCGNFQQAFLILKLQVLLNRVVNESSDQKSFNAYFDKIKLFTCKQNLSQIIQSDPSRFTQIYQICNDQNLSQQQIQNLKKTNLFELYSLVNDIKIHQLRKYISTQLKQPCVYRIRCSQIGNSDISSFALIKELNLFGQIYKYDSKNGIMYFNHKQNISPQNLNHIIDQSTQMTIQLLSAKKQKWGNDKLYYGSFKGRNMFQK